MSGGAVSPAASFAAVNEHVGASNGDPEHFQPVEVVVQEENRRAGSKFESVTAGVRVAPLNHDIRIACDGDSATTGESVRPAVNAVALIEPWFVT